MRSRECGEEEEADTGRQEGAGGQAQAIDSLFDLPTCPTAVVKGMNFDSPTIQYYTWKIISGFLIFHL